MIWALDQETIVKKIDKIPDLVEIVKGSLFEGILTGELRPGEKLQQAKLAEQLGVSRQPVSHAMRLLEEQGILTALDGRSLTVAEPDMTSMMQMLEVRRELDGLAARRAAQKFARLQVTESDQIIIHDIQAVLERNIKKETESVKSNILDDIRFHELIRRLSRNPIIQESLARYVLHHNRFIYLMAKDMEYQIWVEHQQIFNAIVSGEAGNAGKLMRAHIARGTKKLKGMLEPTQQESFDQ